MKKFNCFFVLAFALMYVGPASAQDYPMLDMAANNMIQKYQNATCEQLWMQKEEPKTAQQQEMIQFLKSDPQIRTLFIDKVAPTIVNKMFDCGLIP
jgi:hypothetical protein